ncbi:tripartite-type tricarboxylate transporter receptor subunit TctC [Tamaricihabitans halophyticus]|uniref:Tripartite-type tricarboxylate transporter receptor subunit TctC n=1 Tax=Tamaricihabitans halophyticus TaxID=1262583 RepID=A0A4R2QYH9_9PSEU|nr:tripartite tricarboxylate transporter substrate binding protein [Tamaricihabitans halophyticus]TCP54259.1 tripartite-type tricarboxylate transporter receptor subunit TctC [Tamaricihabitans halophyticus]
MGMAQRRARFGRTGVLAIAALLTAPLAGCAANGAGDYPARNIQITVPYGPGGGTDTAARALAESLQDRLGSSVVIVNQEGGGGTVGTAKIAAAKPDGYQLGVAIDSNLTLQPSITPDIDYTYEDFALIGFSRVPFVLVAAPDAPYDNLAELIAAAKKQPGKIRVGTPGDGSSNDLAARAFGTESGADLAMAGFSGGGSDAVNAVLSGEVELASTTVPVAKGLVEGGKLKILGVLANEEAPGAPGAQTLEEADVSDQTILDSEVYLNIPKDVPDDVVATLEDAVREVTSDKEFTNRVSGLGYIVDYRDSAASANELAKRTKVYDKILEREPELTGGQ